MPNKYDKDEHDKRLAESRKRRKKKAKAKKKPEGRPSKYKPAVCERVIELGKTGASKFEIAGELGISITGTFYTWQEKHPEFLEAVKEAEKQAMIWWERAGREKTFNSSGFNATAYIFQTGTAVQLKANESIKARKAFILSQASERAKKFCSREPFSSRKKFFGPLVPKKLFRACSTRYGRPVDLLKAI